jgi:hypothetical protein
VVGDETRHIRAFRHRPPPALAERSHLHQPIPSKTQFNPTDAYPAQRDRPQSRVGERNRRDRRPRSTD